MPQAGAAVSAHTRAPMPPAEASMQAVDGGQAEKAQLEAKIRAFYERYNPAKLGDVHLVAKYHIGKEDLLNERLRAQYSTDLVEFCRLHPELKGGLASSPAQTGCACVMM